jgi:cobalt/nickel transport system ATP-binding protein
MNDTAVNLKDVGYSYPDGFTAIDSINLEIMSGERVAILGPNGAGKSTLLMHMAGVLTPTHGEVTIFGLTINSKNIHEIRRNVGLTFQNPDDQLFCSTVFEDVAYGPINQGLSENEVASRTREALRQVGLEGYENRPPHHLSEGEKKKVAIATVLSMRPRILIIDEPTANLDPKSREELVGLIRNLSKEQKHTLIAATHDVEVISQIADKIIILNKGRITAQGSVREVFSKLDLLHEARLEQPPIFQLFARIAEKNIAIPGSIPLTIDEAIDEIKNLTRKIGK